jgi:cysteine desulfurase
LIYLDHNASTPIRPEVAEAVRDALLDLPGNPSSAHRDGQAARAAIERARAQVAALLGAEPDEIVFTSGGTEGDHAALIGAALAQQARGRRVAYSVVEHHAIHGAAELLERLGFEAAHLPVEPAGTVAPAAIDALPDDTTTVAVMLANNETGVLQPVAAIAERAHARGMRVVCDAVQAAGKVPIDVARLDVDYLVISGHKLGGPKGAGALVVRRGAPFEPLFRGSAHEHGRRGGTENLGGIVGLGLAAELAARELATEGPRLLAGRRRLEEALRVAFPDAVIHGESAPRLPNTVNVSIPGARSDHLLLALDARGVAVSAGAACSSGAVEPSHVLTAMGVPWMLGTCALRLSIGHTTTDEELGRAIDALIESVRLARAMSGQGVRS